MIAIVYAVLGLYLLGFLFKFYSEFLHGELLNRNAFEDITSNRLPEPGKIYSVTTVEGCKALMRAIDSHGNKFGAVGFGAVPHGSEADGDRDKIAALQLCTHRSVCAVIRLCHLESIPVCLKKLLRSGKILKVGVGPVEDAAKLKMDYGIVVKNTLDLRFMAQIARCIPGDLDRMAKIYLNGERRKLRKEDHKKWNALDLSEEHLDYAAKSAYFGIELFKYFTDEMKPRGNKTWNPALIKNYFVEFVNHPYSESRL